MMSLKHKAYNFFFRWQVSKIKMKDGGLTQKNYNLTRQSLPQVLNWYSITNTDRADNEHRAIKTTVNAEQEWRCLDKTESVRDDELGEYLEIVHHNSGAFVTWSTHSQALNP